MPDITLLKTPTCRINCDKVAVELSKRDISYEFVVIDPDNEVHMAIINAAAAEGYKASPVFCLEDTNGSLQYIAAGPEPIAIQKTLKALRSLATVDA